MCWKSHKIPRRQVAEDDIPVFKIMYKGLKSVYYYMQYKLNTLYDVVLDKPEVVTRGDLCFIFYGSYINRGIHSYDMKNCEALVEYTKSPFGEILKQLHIFGVNGEHLDKLGPVLSLVQVNGVIPKGSIYYLNENGEYVSNQIILIEERAIK